MNEIESFLTSVMGDFDKTISPINNSKTNKVYYSKPLYLYPTIQMVIVAPFVENTHTKEYILTDDSKFLFFVYDKEIDIIFGEIEEIDFDENWYDELTLSIYDVENKIPKYVCPSCDFWLVQRLNKYGHKFLGCSDYPECKFSCEIDSE